MLIFMKTKKQINNTDPVYADEHKKGKFKKIYCWIVKLSRNEISHM